MKTLYITDLDGTLLNDNGVVSDTSVHILNEWMDKGMLFSVASARSPMSAVPLLEKLHIRAPVSLVNGVFLYDLVHDRAVEYLEIPPRALAQAAAVFETHGKSPFLFLYGEDDRMSIQYTALQLQVHRDFYNSRAKMLDNRFYQVEKLYLPQAQHAVLLSLSDTQSALQPIYDRIVQIEGVTASFYPDTYTEYWFLEVFNSKASKGESAKRIAQFVGASEIAAFGDNHNDFSLFDAADKTYAVCNAVPALKSRATKVIGSNEENGVALFLRERFL